MSDSEIDMKHDTLFLPNTVDRLVAIARRGSMSPFGGGESTEGRSVLQKTECMISGRSLDQSAPFYHTYPRAAAQLLSAARYGHREGVRSSASRR